MLGRAAPASSSGKYIVDVAVAGDDVLHGLGSVVGVERLTFEESIHTRRPLLDVEIELSLSELGPEDGRVDANEVGPVLLKLAQIEQFVA